MEERIEAAGLEEAEHVLGQKYASLQLDPVDCLPGTLRLATSWVGPVRLDRMRLRMRFHAEVEPLGAFVFACVRSGHVGHRQGGGAERRFSAGEPFLTVDPDRPYAATIDDLDADLALLDPPLVNEVAQTASARPEDPVRFTGYQAVSVRAAEQFRATYTYVRDQASSSPGFADQPLVAGATARLLAATALATFPNTSLTDPTRTDRHDAHPQTLRRAIAFIETHADQDINVTDIAGAAHVTIRAIQLVFRRHLDTTPMAYLRQVRLQHAHEELQAATPGDTTVTRVASRWGFLSASQFAGRYRDTFAELPSATLQR